MSKRGQMFQSLNIKIKKTVIEILLKYCYHFKDDVIVQLKFNSPN